MILRVGLALLSMLAACGEPEAPRSSYFDERIGPTLRGSCVQQTAGCHLAARAGIAPGNLDLSSYDALMRRDDALAIYGPYPVSLLSLKSGPPVEIAVETLTPPDPSRPDQRFVRVTTTIEHAAGNAFAAGSAAKRTLDRWIAEGHTRTGAPRPIETPEARGCDERASPLDPAFPAPEPTDATSFERYVSGVHPVLQARCGSGGCHGGTMFDLHVPCGDSDQELRYGYAMALAHLSAPAASSELLRRPLSTARGGTFHAGGDVFASTDDEGYAAIRAFAEDVVSRASELLVPTETDEGFRFFVDRVEPVLVREGCMFLSCHSPAMFHDLRLRGGSQGAFSRVAMRRNYEMSRLLLALESEDPRQSRIIAKNLAPAPLGVGVLHRGGALFDDSVDCAAFADDAPLDTVPSYCVLARWHALERELAIERGELDDEGPSAVYFVSRPLGAGDVRDFDTFRGGADLLRAPASIDDSGALALGEATSVLASCGLGGDVDVRGPAVSWDGQRVAFAARASASVPFRLYEMASDGTGCAPIDVTSPADEIGGVLTHDFDPAFAPDGRLVFASTRGGTLTPASLGPDADLYVRDADGAIRQLTYLSNQELAPAFMRDGRLVFTTEKRAESFHQLALRRIDLDGGDYHPLFAQRPSIGFAAATDGCVLPNGDFAFVAGPIDAADGAGAIALVNRSLGPDRVDRDPDDRGYLSSLSMPLPGALSGEAGAFRSPTPLPTGRLLVSCDVAAPDLGSGPFAFALCELDPNRGVLREVAAMPGRALVDAVAIYARPQQGVFRSRLDEVNGASELADGGDAIVHLLDGPMLATLLFANTRTGRPVDARVRGLDVLRTVPPQRGAAPSFTDAFGPAYLERELLGHVDLEADGSAKIALPAGVPFSLRLTDAEGRPLVFEEDAPFEGEMLQREEMQLYPGERARMAMPRRFFNGLCGGCHGSITGRELDIAVDVDVLTHASETLARDLPPTSMIP